jgi:hypothetical protein
MYLYKYNMKNILFLRMQIGEKISNIGDYSKPQEPRPRNKGCKLYREKIENCVKNIINISENLD